jgi:hypothetical protein
LSASQIEPHGSSSGSAAQMPDWYEDHKFRMLDPLAFRRYADRVASGPEQKVCTAGIQEF